MRRSVRILGRLRIRLPKPLIASVTLALASFQILPLPAKRQLASLAAKQVKPLAICRDCFSPKGRASQEAGASKLLRLLRLLRVVARLRTASLPCK